MNGNSVISIYHFLSTIGVKGIGETTIKTIYDNGINTLGDFLSMKQSDINYLGPKISENIVMGIKNSLDTVSLTTLIYASSTLGRGIGKKKIEEIFDMYPNFLDIMKENNKEKMINMLIQVKGIAHKTASTITSNIDKMFLYFKNNNIDINKFSQSQSQIQSPIQSQIQSKIKSHKFLNYNVCMSGFRDEEIKNIVESNGGKISQTMTKSVNLLLVKNKESITSKVQKAIDDGIRIMTKDEFMKL
jgi:NAD-dependent DNA ligase